MKLKSLLAIMPCAVIVVSSGIPARAETVKEGYIQTESTNIQNKDSRNKQSTPSMVGNWKSSVEDNEYRHLDPMEIYWDIKSDGTTTFAFRPKNGDNFSETTYQYSPIENQGGIWKEDFGSGKGALCTIKWVSNNEFVLTIVKEYTRPEREGIQRRFVRVNEPVATQLKEKAQRAANRQQRRNAALEVEKARGRLNGAMKNTGAVQRIYNSPYSSPF